MTNSLSAPLARLIAGSLGWHRTEASSRQPLAGRGARYTAVSQGTDRRTAPLMMPTIE